MVSTIYIRALGLIGVWPKAASSQALVSSVYIIFK